MKEERANQTQLSTPFALRTSVAIVLHVSNEMNSHSTKLEPSNGWASQDCTKELIAAVYSHLDTKRKISPWNYYNFTSQSAIWDSDDSKERNILSLEFEGGSEEKIADLNFEIAESSSVYRDDLTKLKERLTREFNLKQSHC